jgi:hypothetical protein
MDFFGDNRLFDYFLDFDELFDSLDDDLFDLFDDLLGSSVALLAKVGVLEGDLSFGVFVVDYGFGPAILGGHSCL